MSNFNVVVSGGVPVKMWTKDVPVEYDAIRQLERISRIPFIYKWVAAMPDMHVGMGATIGSVIATKGAVIPAAVGVDIGCGMRAVRINLARNKLPELPAMRATIEAAVPTGFKFHETVGKGIKFHWQTALESGYTRVISDLPIAEHKHVLAQLGTLGGGNHFIEVSLDEVDRVWIVIHSGSRGVGNRIGVNYIKLAKKMCKNWHIKLEDPALAYLPQETKEFKNYMFAAAWAQQYARINRTIMMETVLKVLSAGPVETIDCHHNYIAWENHYGENVMVTRKGAVRAQEEDWGIIPGSMGVKSFITRGLGNAESFNSCSHGAGRVMSRSKAKATITVEEHEKATEGVECRKDKAMLDESPAAYKDIDAVMAAQSDLCVPVHTLKQMVCVKGAVKPNEALLAAIKELKKRGENR